MAGEWRPMTLRAANVTLIDCDHRTPPATEDGYPYVAIPQMRGGRIELAGARRISREHYLEWTRKAKPSANDVVLSRRCNPGETAVAPAGAEFALGQNLVLLRADGTKVYPPFLRWLVRGPDWWEQIGKFNNVGAVFDSLKCADIPKFELLIPPRPEQRAIAHILGTLDDKIELNRRMNETLEAMARALFKSWFVDFDPVRAKAEGRDPGLPKALADLFPACLVDSELGEIPEGWDVGPLGALGELAIGGDWGEDEAFAGAIEANCLRGVDLEYLRRDGHASAPRRWFKPKSLERRAMDERDVLVAGSGAGPTGRPLWMCAGLLLTLGPCVYSNFCKRIRCRSAAEAVYLDSWLHGMRKSGEIWEYVNGTSVPNLDANSLLSGKAVPIPPMSVLDKYCDFVRPIWQEKYLGENHTLSALRDTLLPKLTSGELRVQDAEKSIGRTS
jgi:type I restriction enzyme S subunit